MASKSFSEEDFSCPVCCDIYKDPVILSCSHSICEVCLQQFWKTKQCRECPVCRRISKEACPPNLALKTLCETFLQGRQQKDSDSGSKGFCSLHKEKIKLFCLEDQQPLCLVCRDSRMHKNHSFTPIDEAVQERKDVVKIKLQSLLKQLENFKKAKTTCDETAQHIRVQAQHTERKIKEEFEKLYQFLRDEEASRIAALRQEESWKSQKIREKIEKINIEISSLSDTIKGIEKMEADDITFLQNYKSIIERAHCKPQNPEEVHGALINVAKYLGNLNFKVWEKMQEMVQYTPVTLDPNTANPKLILSEDLTGMRLSNERQQIPDNPERFAYLPCLLGSEGFKSGTHSWDVEVGDSETWIIGVTENSVKRKGNKSSHCEGWYILYSSGTCRAYPTVQFSPNFTRTSNPKKIRVDLDCDKGEVSYSKAPGGTICSHNYTGKEVFPFFLTSKSLRITPWITTVKAVRHKESSCSVL